MLRLTRRPHEQLIFQIKDSNGKTTEFTLTIDSARGSQVRMAIDAPQSVNIYRSELREG